MTKKSYQGEYHRNKVELAVWLRAMLHAYHEKGGNHDA